MVAALEKYSECLRAAGFDYSHPDDLEPDFRKRLDAITDGQPVDSVILGYPGALASASGRRAPRRWPRSTAKSSTSSGGDLIEREMYANPPK
jgi:hypothetical protein